MTRFLVLLLMASLLADPVTGAAFGFVSPGNPVSSHPLRIDHDAFASRSVSFIRGKLGYGLMAVWTANIFAVTVQGAELAADPMRRASALVHDPNLWAVIVATLGLVSFLHFRFRKSVALPNELRPMNLKPANSILPSFAMIGAFAFLATGYLSLRVGVLIDFNSPIDGRTQIEQIIAQARLDGTHQSELIFIGVTAIAVAVLIVLGTYQLWSQTRRIPTKTVNTVSRRPQDPTKDLPGTMALHPMEGANPSSTDTDFLPEVRLRAIDPLVFFVAPQLPESLWTAVWFGSVVWFAVAVVAKIWNRRYTPARSPATRPNPLADRLVTAA